MPSIATATATATMSSTGINGVVEQANIPQETTTVFQADGSHLASTVWPNAMETTTMFDRNAGDPVAFHFGWIDYGLFIVLLGISTLIGIYYGFFSKHKQNNMSEYILGGRSMKILPVATSMIASLV